MIGLDVVIPPANDRSAQQMLDDQQDPQFGRSIPLGNATVTPKSR
jgi:hypothetical protein